MPGRPPPPFSLWPACRDTPGLRAIRNAAKKAISDLKFSPRGDILAVGSHDHQVYLLDTGSWRAFAALKGHSSYVTHIDWAASGEFLQVSLTSRVAFVPLPLPLLHPLLAQRVPRDCASVWPLGHLTVGASRPLVHHLTVGALVAATEH